MQLQVTRLNPDCAYEGIAALPTETLRSLSISVNDAVAVDDEPVHVVETEPSGPVVVADDEGRDPETAAVTMRHFEAALQTDGSISRSTSPSNAGSAD